MVHYPENQVFPAVVTSILSFGGFARLEDGLEGPIHLIEIQLLPNQGIKDIITLGQIVDARIIYMDISKHRLSLNLRKKREHA